MYKNWACLLLLVVLQVQADDAITVYNTTKQTVWAIVYCVPTIFGSPAIGGQLHEIPAGESTKVVRPSSSLTCVRELTFSLHKDDLPASISKPQFNALASIGIGTTSAGRMFDNFYIVQEQQGLKGYNTLTWQLRLMGAYEQLLLASSALVNNNPYKDRIASVRIGADVCPQEKAYVQVRTPKVQAALEKFLGKKLNGSFIPKIALINSGGGARALISCLGWHAGAEKIGLLDAVTYDIGLSGGSWFITTWMASGKRPSVFKGIMQPLMNKELYPSGTRIAPNDLQQFFDALIIRDALKQPVTLVNAWGASLANRYFDYGAYSDKRQQLLLSDQAQTIASGDWPLPILTAANGYASDIGENRYLMDWFEFTPYEVSGVGDWLGNAHIPIWAFGRTYKGTASIDNNPPYDIGLIMGICGSAFALTYARLYEKALKSAVANIPLFKSIAEQSTDMLITKLLPQDAQDFITTKRLSVGKVPNFAKDIPGSRVKEADLKLVDAGLAFNLPSPSAHARSADIMIFFDASGTALGKSLDWVAKYAMLHNYKFPAISLDGIDQRTVTIFTDEKNTNMPLVMYMPRTDPTGTVDTNFSTVKFNYTADEYNQLSGVTEQNMVSSKDQIKAAITKLIERRGGFRE